MHSFVQEFKNIIPEKIEIYPENLKTRTIFNPYFTYEVANIEDTELIYTMDLEIMRNNGQKNQTKPYEVGYFSVDYLGEREYSDEELIKIINEGETLGGEI